MDALPNKSALKAYHIVFYLFLFTYFACLIYLGSVQNVWEDETYTLHTTANKLPEVLRLSYTFEGQVPVYFLLLAIWRLISTKILFAKLFSIISIGLAALFFNKLCGEVNERKENKWAVIIFLLNPFSVWAALEIRVYAFLVLLSSITLYYFIRYYNRGNKKNLYIFLIVALIGVYTQYFFTLLIASLAFSLLIYKGWKTFFKFCLYLIPIVILFLPNFLFLQSQVQMHQQSAGTDVVLKNIFTLLYTPQDFLLALQIIPVDRWLRWLIKIIILFLLLLGYYKLFKNCRLTKGKTFERLNILLFTVLALIILYCVIILFTHIEYSAKYFAIALPIILLVYLVFYQYKPELRNIFFSTCALYFAFLLLLFYRVPIKNYDYKSIVNYVTEIENPGEPLVFYNSFIVLPFETYYKGKNNLVSIPGPITFDSNYVANLKDTSLLIAKLRGDLKESSSFLFISNDMDQVILNRNMNRPMLDSFLNSHYKIILDTLVHGRSKDRYLRIRRFSVK